MNQSDFEPTRKLTSRAQAREALDTTLGETRRFLRIFDLDGRFYGFERRTFAQALRTLLTHQGDARVLMVLHDTEHVEKHCPMVIQLLRSFSPRLSILTTSGEIRGFARGLVIADQAAVLRRPHFDHAVTYIDYDDKAIASAASLFEDILGHSTQTSLGQATGL